MERITYQTGTGWQVPEGRLEEALERLARFENACAAISAELESLRAAGRQKSARFRELLGRKLTNQQLLLRLEDAGIS